MADLAVQSLELITPAGTNASQQTATLANFQQAVLQVGLSPTIPAPTGAAQTIATNTGIVSRTNPAGAVTAAILQAGTVNGQIVIVTNEATTVANSITFSTTLATGLVLTDATPDANVIKASSASMFIWLTSLNGGNGAWVKISPFGG